MTWSVYGILIVFGLFIIILIFNPKLSCFGKRIRSPFYPFRRRKRNQKKAVKVTDYGLNLGDGQMYRPFPDSKSPAVKRPVESYGFNLDDNASDQSGEKKDPDPS